MNWLEDFLEEVLAHRFKSEPIKQKVLDNDKGFQFACPFCGDSKSDPNKKRGHIYTSSRTFKCFNDGCMRWMPLDRFVSKFALEYDIDLSDIDLDELQSTYGQDGSRLKLQNNAILESFRESGTLEALPHIDEVTRGFGLYPVSDSGANRAVRAYLSGRLLNMVPTAFDRMYTDNTDAAVFLVNQDAATGRVLSLCTRKISSKKYNIIPYTEMCRVMGLEVLAADPGVVDTLGEYYNLFNVDLSKPVKITEGQIDSEFLVNGLAIQGVTKAHFIYEFIRKDLIYTVFDNDKAGFGSTKEAMEIGYRSFMWALLLSRMRRTWPDEVRRIVKIKDVNDLYKFLFSLTRLDVYAFNQLADKYFSNSSFDLFYV